MAYSKHNLKIKDFASPYVSNNRLEISGVFFKPNETVATDGFSLIRVSSIKSMEKEFPILPGNTKSQPKTNFNPFIVPAQGVKKLLKTIPEENKHLPVLNFLYVSKVDKNMVEFVTTDLENTHRTTVRTIEGKYPRFEEICKEVGSYYEVEVNVNYLKRITDTCVDLMAEDRLQYIKIKFSKSKKIAPIIFIADNKTTQQKSMAYLMPIIPIEERQELNKKN